MIRSIIHRQLCRNMFGMFNFFNKQVNEKHKTYQVYQQQYQNAQNVSQRLDIMKNIINLKYEQDRPSLDTLDNYYTFITDYKRCERNKLKIDKETTEEFQQILQKFLDPLIFDKVQVQVVDDSCQEQFDFLKLNQQAYMIDRELEKKDLGLYKHKQILDEMIQIIKKYLSENTLATRLMSTIIGFQQNLFLFIINQHQLAEIQMVDLLNNIRELQKQQLQKLDFISENQIREFLYNYELKILNQLMFFASQMNEGENCIEYQNQLLQLVKENEGISKYYLSKLQEFNRLYYHFNQYRSLQLIEETCLQLEKNEDFFFLQLQRILILVSLNQITKKDYEQILKLYDEIKIITPRKQRLFYAALLNCDIQLKQFKDYQKYIDLLLHPFEIGNGLIQQLMEIRYQIYQDFKNNIRSHKSAYKDILAYFDKKITPLHDEVKRNFAEKFFQLSKIQQRLLYNDMKAIVKDYLHKGIFEDNQNLIKEVLEELIKIQMINQSHRDTLIEMFDDLKKEPTMNAQVIGWLSQYIRLLQEDQKQ